MFLIQVESLIEIYVNVLFLILHLDKGPNRIREPFSERMAVSSIPHAKIPLVAPPEIVNIYLNICSTTKEFIKQPNLYHINIFQNGPCQVDFSNFNEFFH